MISQMLTRNILRWKLPPYKMEIYALIFSSYISFVAVLKIKPFSTFDETLEAKRNTRKMWKNSY